MKIAAEVALAAGLILFGGYPAAKADEGSSAPSSAAAASPTLAGTHLNRGAAFDSVLGKTSSKSDDSSSSLRSDSDSKSLGGARQLSLSAAIAQALKVQPTLRQAQAQTRAAAGRVEQARAGYLPQVTGTAGYQRTTGNFAVRPGSIPSSASLKTSYSLSTTYDFFNFSLTASQLIYDFGQTNGRWSAADSAVSALTASEDAMRFQTVMNVQSAFYQAWAQRALVDVAKETLDNQQRHLAQIEASVKVGVRPDIDLAQARANVANARVQVINTQNAYELAKTQLNAAIGIMAAADYEVADEEAAPIAAEDGPGEPLVTQALAARPDVVALLRQHEAQTKTLRSLRGGYGPSLVASSTGTEQGVQLNNMVPNWNVGVTLTWPILQGGLTNGQIREAEANLEVIDAQLATLRLQIRTQVDQSRLAVRAAKATIGAADEALASAQLQLKLAEGRYSAGVGSVIELADAQVAYTNARAQVVQAHFNLSNSRAQLVTALGLR